MIKSIKSFVIALFLLLTVTQTSCTSDDDTNTNVNSECESTICTIVLMTINVSIKDQDQNPVALDSFKVINKDNGDDMTLTLSPTALAAAKELGSYLLIQDGVLERNQKRNLQFKGYINNQEVITSDYKVSTDCCHIGLDTGNLELTL